MKEIWEKFKTNFKSIMAAVGIVAVITAFMNPIAENIVNSIFNWIWDGGENSLEYLEGNLKVVDSDALIEYREGIVSPLQVIDDQNKLAQSLVTESAYSNLNHCFRKGCTLNTYINNKKNKNVAISKCTLIVQNIQKVESAEPIFLAYIKDNELKIVAVNNGNAVMEEGRVRIIGEYLDKEQNLLQLNESDLSTLFWKGEGEISIPDLKKGEILEIASWEMNDFNISKWRENAGSWLNLYGRYEETKSGKVWDNIFIGCFEYVTSPVIFRGQGSEPDDYVIKRVVLLDAEKENGIDTEKEIDIPTEFYIDANSTKNIQISILPNTSCNISFYAEFSAAGEAKIKTELFQQEISVPVYEDNEGLYTDLLESIMKNHIEHYEFNGNKLIQNEMEYESQSIVK